MKAMRVSRFATVCLLSGFVLSSIAPLWAQSLGDVAKKEEERRKAVGEAGKVYTNKDLPNVPAASTPAPPQQATPETKIDAAKDKPKDASAADKAKPATETVKDQAYWAERKKTLESQLGRDQTLSDALQSRINGLTTDFVNRSDPAQRAIIERDRQKALAELNNLKKQIDDDKKALAGFEEEARRAGVPPGWLR
jgi:hypothetical protein